MKNTPEQADRASKLSFPSASAEANSITFDTALQVSLANGLSYADAMLAARRRNGSKLLPAFGGALMATDLLTLHEYDFPSYEDANSFLLTIQHVVPGGLAGTIGKPSNTLSIAITASEKCSIDRLYSYLSLASPNQPCFVIDYTVSGSHYRVVQVLEANLLSVLSLLRAHSGITYTVRRGILSFETGQLVSVGSLVEVF